MKKSDLKQVLLTLVLSSLLLVTCAPGAQATEAVTSPPEQPTAATAQPTATQEPTATEEPSATGEPVDVRLMSWADGDFEQWALETLVERFNATHPGYHADVQVER